MNMQKKNITEQIVHLLLFMHQEVKSYVDGEGITAVGISISLPLKSVCNHRCGKFISDQSIKQWNTLKPDY